MKLGLTLFTVLSAIAAVHVYWAFGGLWPATSEPELVRTVVGMANGQQMPARSGTLIVAFLVFAGGVVALVRSMSLPRLMAWIPLIGSIVLAAVFSGAGCFHLRCGGRACRLALSLGGAFSDTGPNALRTALSSDRHRFFHPCAEGWRQGA